MIFDTTLSDDIYCDEVIGEWQTISFRIADLASACGQSKQAYSALKVYGNQMLDDICDVATHRYNKHNKVADQVLAEQAFEQLHKTFNPRVKGSIYRRLKSDPIKEDLEQEVWKRIYGSVKPVGAIDEFIGFLHAVINNVIIDYWRAEISRYRSKPLELDNEDPFDSTGKKVQTPEQTLITLEDQQQDLQDARMLLQLLRPEDRLIMILSKNLPSEEQIRFLLGPGLSKSDLELMNLNVFHKCLESNQQTTPHPRNFNRQKIVDMLKDKSNVKNVGIVRIRRARAIERLKKYVSQQPDGQDKQRLQLLLPALIRSSRGRRQ
jgi:DNA-directed RNA polymerase specialized sigma24 family protein